MSPQQFKAARHKLGLTGKKLAEIIGVAPRTIRGWEQPCDSRPPPEYAVKCVRRLLDGLNQDEVSHD